MAEVTCTSCGKRKREDVAPETEEGATRQEQLRTLADAANNKIGTSPLLDFMIDHQSAFEDSFLPWLDCYDYRNLGRVCRTLRHVFEPSNDATWNVIVRQLKVEKERERKWMKENNKQPWQGDRRLFYVRDDQTFSAWERVWLGQVDKARLKDQRGSFFHSVILHEFATQFGNSNKEISPECPPTAAFRKLWLLPLVSTLKKHPAQRLTLVLSDKFCACFAQLVEKNLRSFIHRALTLADTNVDASARPAYVTDNHMYTLADLSGEYIYEPDNVYWQLDVDFPMPYNHRIMRRVTYNAHVLRISNRGFKELWSMFIKLSVSLLNALIPEPDMHAHRKWRPTELGLMEAAKRIHIFTEKCAENIKFYEVLDDDEDRALHNSNHEFKDRWKKLNVQNKMDTCTDKSDSEESSDESGSDEYDYSDED